MSVSESASHEGGHLMDLYTQDELVAKQAYLQTRIKNATRPVYRARLQQALDNIQQRLQP